MEVLGLIIDSLICIDIPVGTIADTKRSQDVGRDTGLDPSGIGSPILPEYWLKNHARETLAWGKYYVNKFLPFVPID